MKLYITPLSPYARMARMFVLEKKFESRVEIILAQTRTTQSPYYAINPSGRVPYLVRDDGVGMEESALICAYLDQLDGAPILERASLEAQRLEALARSMVDGVSVWNRERRDVRLYRHSISLRGTRQGRARHRAAHRRDGPAQHHHAAGAGRRADGAAGDGDEHLADGRRAVAGQALAPLRRHDRRRVRRHVRHHRSLDADRDRRGRC